MDDAVQTVMLQCELWTDNYVMDDNSRSDMMYDYDSEVMQAAERNADY